MILESVDEIRAQGVTVYPHVVAPQPWCEQCNLPAKDVCAIETIVTLWQQLDAMQECDLAGAMVRANELGAEGFHMALGMALEAVRSPRYVGEDAARHARIWDKLAPFLQDDEDMAQAALANAQV